MLCKDILFDFETERKCKFLSHMKQKFQTLKPMENKLQKIENYPAYKYKNVKKHIEN